MQPIFIFTGPPAAGKSTLACALLSKFEFGVHIPVDELRQFVVSGIAHPLEWTDETTRQFSLAEHAAADIALRYNDAGFAVALDHCSGPPSWQEIIDTRLSGRVVIKIVLAPSLSVNHRRNQTRQGKEFGPEILTDTIDRLNPLYRESNLEEQGWIVFENDDPTPEQSVARLEILYRAAIVPPATTVLPR